MTAFDESKHNRHSDGKFANKPHAEADGVDLATQGTGEAPTLPPRLEELGFDLDYATDEYLRIALETERSWLDEEAGEPVWDTDLDHSDFDARDRAEVSKDIAQFLTDNAEDIETVMVEHGVDTSRIATAFFAERGGWGAWFRGSGYGEVGERLSAATQKYELSAAPILRGGKLYFE